VFKLHSSVQPLNSQTSSANTAEAAVLHEFGKKQNFEFKATQRVAFFIGARKQPLALSHWPLANPENPTKTHPHPEACDTKT
jgi:hypothetical protein